MYTDPISDFLTRVRNASKAGKDQCVSPHSKMKAEIARILKEEGFIQDASEGEDVNGHKALVVTLRYVDGEPSFCILTTPKGLMKDRDARRQKLGGEMVCNVW